jgi:hypothetical protein
MRTLQLLFYEQSFALASYDKYWNAADNSISPFIEVMKIVPDDKNWKIVNNIIDGWVGWVKKCFSESNLQFDIIIKALGHSEVEVDTSKPMHIFCERLAKEIKASFIPDLIHKTRHTQSQTELSGKERRYNIRGAFWTSETYDTVKGRNILVVDDIKTTGSTLNEIAKVLSFQGSNKLYCLALGETSQNKDENAELLEWMNRFKNNA